ncbi:MAG: L,D-transpeptidase [Bacteroidales bacterium]|jgi:hypothetical protein|nr:L,D-transpeptidase [Bacteroidales bacterium]
MQQQKTVSILFSAIIFLIVSCSPPDRSEENQRIRDSVQAALQQQRFDSMEAIRIKFLPENILLEKGLLYEKHTLDDVYPYKDTQRVFQWEKIRIYLALVDSMQMQTAQWGFLKNRNNINGEAPLTEHAVRNAYKNMEDTFGVERFQGIPFYFLDDTLAVVRYGLDGSLVKVVDDADAASAFITVWHAATKQAWKTPRKYIKYISDTAFFQKAAFVDRRNQNIATIEKENDTWLIRSMNPATTGVHRPPYMRETPLGIFVLQEKKVKMFFLKDGSTATGGFAPFASRFCNGGYIHGIPVNVPQQALIEYSASLGTTPRSHMCVRNATSHAEFFFHWAALENALVIVLE